MKQIITDLLTVFYEGLLPLIILWLLIQISAKLSKILILLSPFGNYLNKEKELINESVTSKNQG